MKKFILFVPVVVAFFLVMVLAYKGYCEEGLKWDAENKCIAEYIAEGFERSRIVRDNGSCYLK